MLRTDSVLGRVIIWSRAVSLEEEKPSSIVKPNISNSRSRPDDFLSVLTAFPDLGIEVGADHQGTGDHVKYVHLDIIRY